MAKANYSAKVYQGGAPVATTGAATTLLSGKTYRINTVVRRTIDPDATVTVKDNGVTVASSEYTIYWFSGKIEFDSGYTITGPITIDYSYVPLVYLGNLNSVMPTVSRDNEEDTVFNNNAGWKTHKTVLKSSEVSLGGFESINPTLGDNGVLAAFNSADKVLVKFTTSDGENGFGGWFQTMSLEENADVGALLKGSSTLKGYTGNGWTLDQMFEYF